MKNFFIWELHFSSKIGCKPGKTDRNSKSTLALLLEYLELLQFLQGQRSNFLLGFYQCLGWTYVTWNCRLGYFFSFVQTLKFSPKLTKTKGLSWNITQKYCLKLLNLNHKVLFSQVFMTEHTSENISMQNTKSRVFAERGKYFFCQQ